MYPKPRQPLLAQSVCFGLKHRRRTALRYASPRRSQWLNQRDVVWTSFGKYLFAVSLIMRCPRGENTPDFPNIAISRLRYKLENTIGKNERELAVRKRQNCRIWKVDNGYLCSGNRFYHQIFSSLYSRAIRLHTYHFDSSKADKSDQRGSPRCSEVKGTATLEQTSLLRESVDNILVSAAFHFRRKEGRTRICKCGG